MSNSADNSPEEDKKSTPRSSKSRRSSANESEDDSCFEDSSQQINHKSKSSRRKKKSRSRQDKSSADASDTDTSDIENDGSRMRSHRRKKKRAPQSKGSDEVGGVIEESMLMAINRKRKEKNAANVSELEAGDQPATENRDSLDVAMGKTIPEKWVPAAHFDTNGIIIHDEPSVSAVGDSERSLGSALRPSKYGGYDTKKPRFADEPAAMANQKANNEPSFRLGHGSVNFDSDDNNTPPKQKVGRHSNDNDSRQSSWKPNAVNGVERKDVVTKKTARFRRSLDQTDESTNAMKSSKYSQPQRSVIKRRTSMEGSFSARRPLPTGQQLGGDGNSPDDVGSGGDLYRPGLLESLKSVANINHTKIMRRNNMSTNDQTYIPPKDRNPGENAEDNVILALEPSTNASFLSQVYCKLSGT